MNDHSNTQNTGIYMSVSNVTPTKKRIIKSLIDSVGYQITLGIDARYESSLGLLKNIINQVDVKLVDNRVYFDKYGQKIKNFNGRWPDNCAKLSAYDWFTNSSFEYMWYMEDDVYAKDWNKFFEKYKNLNVDLISKRRARDPIFPSISELPFWCFNHDSDIEGNIGWRIGHLSHVIHNAICHLYLHRSSKKLATQVIQSIIEEHKTSHHELWLPYICKNFDYSLIELNEEDCRHSMFNEIGQDELGYSLNFIQNEDCNIFHPAKILDDYFYERKWRNE